MFFLLFLEVEDSKIMENDIDTSCRDMGAWRKVFYYILI